MTDIVERLRGDNWWRLHAHLQHYRNLVDELRAEIERLTEIEKLYKAGCEDFATLSKTATEKATEIERLTAEVGRGKEEILFLQDLGRALRGEIARLRADLDILRRHYNLHPDAPLSREETIAAKDAEINCLTDRLNAALQDVMDNAVEIKRLKLLLDGDVDRLLRDVLAHLQHLPAAKPG